MCLLSSTRYDELLTKFRFNDDHATCPFLLLQYHYDRLIEAAELHNWQKAKESLTYWGLKQKCEEKVVEAGNPRSAKIRVTLSEAGELDVTVSELTPLKIDPFELAGFNPALDYDTPESIITVTLDSQATLPSLLTRTKTTRRAMYDEARTRANITSPDSEVLLFNDDSLIMEGSISNVYFCRNDRWLTPSTSTGCLPGVARRYLLEKGLAHEDVDHQLTVSSVRDGEWVLLSNGVHGCRLGKIRLGNKC